MFKYKKYERVETATTVLEFRGGDDAVKVNYFDTNVVSLQGDEADIDALVKQQPAEIKCTAITQEEFKEIVTDSAQLNRIREVVASAVAKKYSFADEMALSKRAVDDVKRVAYDAYVSECILIGHELKSNIGY